MQAIGHGGDGSALVWAAEAARVAAPERFEGLLRQAVAVDPPPADSGMAWCRLAELCEIQGQPIGQAWLQAAEQLPTGHPWRLSAIARSAHTALVEGGDLARVERLLRSVSPHETTAEALRCRWLLAQLCARRGQLREARQLALGLVDLADENQRARVQDFLAQLVPEDGGPGDTP